MPAFDGRYPLTALLDLYARSIAFGTGLFVALTALPVVAKWLLIGRFKAQSIPIWSLAYFRFWAVKTLMRSSPATAFMGTPLYNAYLRLMGARIGRNVILKCRFAPVCTDLLKIGDNTVLSKDTIVLGYRAQSNFIQTGSVEIGSKAFVGEASVIDIDTAMGDDTQLGHASSLQSGQRVPDGKRYHGSPAVETTSNYCPIETRASGELRGWLYVSLGLAILLMVAIPAFVFTFYYIWGQYSQAADAGTYFNASTLSCSLALSAALFFGSIAIGLMMVYVVPRLCMMALRPGVTYRTFGIHYLLQNIIQNASNSQFFCSLFGDSSFIVKYMRYVGWNLNTIRQTGSNMGLDQRHDNPSLCNIGSGTMVSDGLYMINMQMSATSFRLDESRIGDKNYVGNDVFYPPNGRTGANVLLGTKTMIPIDGPMRENVGLLGSPPFEIPRMVERDRDIIASFDEKTRLARLSQKNEYNFVTALLFLASHWMALFATFVVLRQSLSRATIDSASWRSS